MAGRRADRLSLMFESNKMFPLASKLMSPFCEASSAAALERADIPRICNVWKL